MFMDQIGEIIDCNEKSRIIRWYYFELVVGSRGWNSASLGIRSCAPKCRNNQKLTNCKKTYNIGYREIFFYKSMFVI